MKFNKENLPKAIVAVDFDLTIVNSTYPTIHSLKDGARESLIKLKQAGCYLIIWTCRYGEPCTDAINYLIENNVPFDRVNDNLPILCEAFNNNTRKIAADFYIDDKDWQIHSDLTESLNFPNWEKITFKIIEAINRNSFKSVLHHVK